MSISQDMKLMAVWSLQVIHSLIPNAAGKLLKGRLWISSAADPNSRFSILWKFGIKCGWLFRFRQYYSNDFQLNWKAIVLHRVVEVINAKHPDYSPRIHLRGVELIYKIRNSKKNVVLVTIHTGISLSIVRVLNEFGIESSLIAVGNPQEELTILGGNCELDVICRSKYSLVEARRKLRQGKWIVCCADDAPVESGKTNETLLMGTGIFNFAKRTEAEIIFAVAQVSNDGEIVVECARGNANSNEIANDFIAFLDSVLMIKKKWKIVRWGTLSMLQDSGSA
jgi:hypothetical protein